TADPGGRTLLNLLQMQRIGEDDALSMSKQLPALMNEDLDGPAAVAAIRGMIPGIEALMDKDLAAAQTLASELDIDLPLVDVTRRMERDTLGMREGHDV